MRKTLLTIVSVLVAIVWPYMSFSQQDAESAKPAVRVLIERARPDLAATEATSTAEREVRPGTAARASLDASRASNVPVGSADVPPTVSLRRPALSAFVMEANRPPRSVDPGAGAVELRAGDLLLTRTVEQVKRAPASAALRENAIRLELPYKIDYVNAAGVLKTSGLVAEVAGGGLRLAEDGRKYLGRVYVALLDETDPAATYEFERPASLLVTASVDSVEPDTFDLGGTNRWQSVALQARNPRDPVPLHVRASNDPSGFDLELTVDRPALVVKGNPPSVQGLGLELMDIVVTAPDVPSPGGRAVTLDPSRGKLADTTLELGANGSATTTLRSIGAGPVTVTAMSDGLDDGVSHGLSFLWPVSFLIAAIAGGVVGAAIRILQARARLSSWRRWVTRLAAGALVGIAVAVLYAIGVNLLPIAPSATAGEALVFGLALVGGFLGLRIPQTA